MPIRKKLPPDMNGFKVVKDLGLENKIRYAILICKVCNKEFKQNMYSVKVIKSCGCFKNHDVLPLKDVINGFKILKDFGYKNGSRRALAICRVCRKEYEVDPNKLKYRKHCGCIKNGERVSKFTRSHSRLLQIHKHMMKRCHNPNDQDFYNYGAKGILVCEEWFKKPDTFCEWALKNGYQDDLSIDRIDSSKGYFPENCRWADAIMQARNTSRNVLTLELAMQMRKDRKTMTYRELANKYKVSQGTIAAVIYNRIWN